MTTEPPALNVDRLLTTLDRYEVDFLLVGGVAAIAYGSRRPTADLDCVARRSSGNLDRLAAALRSLNARLRVRGLTDEEAARLPTRIDKETMGRMEISTWRTDAGDFDVLADLRVQPRLARLAPGRCSPEPWRRGLVIGDAAG